MSPDSAQDNMPEQEIEEPVVSEQVASEQATETPAADDALNTDIEPQAGAPIFAAAPLDEQKIQNILEAALMAAGQPLSIDRMLNLFLDHNQPSREEVHTALARLTEACEGRGIELVEVGSGFRYQARQENAEWVARLWEEKPARYSRALLETLALIAYRQPITRGEIEDIRGVSVSTNIMKTLMDRDWVKVVGHRDVPGKPAMYASTRQFLDYFNLKTLSDLPSLAEIRDIDSINAELDFVESSTDRKPDSSDVEVQLDLAANDVVDEASVDAGEVDTDERVADESDVDESDADVLAETTDEPVSADESVEPSATEHSIDEEDAAPAVDPT
jgi:segregation and condensation protein B